MTFDDVRNPEVAADQEGRPLSAPLGGRFRTTGTTRYRGICGGWVEYSLSKDGSVST
jgi:hypothetical protein